MTTPAFTPINRGGYSLDAVAQEILLEVIQGNGQTTTEEISSLVQAQCRAPGPHAQTIARAFLTFLSNRGILHRAEDGTTWKIAT